MNTINVIDIEATCWARGEEPPPNQKTEIIEIGVAEVCVGGKNTPRARSYPIHPTGSKVSSFCTKLTGWTDEALATAPKFREAVSTMRGEFLTHERIWASWGDYDRRQFERQCQERSVPYPFGRRHINVKTLFMLTFNLAEEVPVGQAFDILDDKAVVPPGGHGFKGTPHRGVDDAVNIARLLATILICSRAGQRLPGDPVDHQGHRIHVVGAP